jgi:hypothetical protein
MIGQQGASLYWTHSCKGKGQGWKLCQRCFKQLLTQLYCLCAVTAVAAKDPSNALLLSASENNVEFTEMSARAREANCKIVLCPKPLSIHE